MKIADVYMYIWLEVVYLFEVWVYEPNNCSFMINFETDYLHWHFKSTAGSLHHLWYFK